MRSFQLSVRSRAGAVALGIAVVLIGFVVIVSGIALLIGVALMAVLAAGAAILLRRMFGRPAPPPVRRTEVRGFDPALEVFPPPSQESRSKLADPVRPREDDSGGRGTGQGA